MRRLLAILPILLFATAYAQQEVSKQRHWTLTDTETLWVGRYSNCQYRYYSLLPDGVVAHAEHPPSPHHGFTINLPDVGVRTEVSVYNSNRFLWVNAEYNVTDESTLAKVGAHYIRLNKQGKNKDKLVERRRFELQSVPAIRFRIEHDTTKGRVIEEEVIALRSGIVYEIGLMTPAESYTVDRERFEETIANFRFNSVPPSQCSNE